MESLTKEGLKARFHQLDLDDPTSIDRIKQFLQKNYGGLDLLVNNAGIAYRVLMFSVHCNNFLCNVMSNLYSAFFCSTQKPRTMNKTHRITFGLKTHNHNHHI